MSDKTKHVCVYSSDQILRSIERIRSLIREIIARAPGRTARHAYGSVRIEMVQQHVMARRPTDPLDSRIFDIIVSHALESERLGPGGFVIFLRDLTGDIDIRNVGDEARDPTWDDVEAIIRSVSDRPQVTDVIIEAISMAGFKGRIVIEGTPCDTWSVEASSGYTFDLSPVYDVKVDLCDPRVAIIDGMVESVSEIHHLLEASAAAKEPMLLFVRGLHADVTQTLRVNFDRKTLSVVPYIVRFDLEGLNTLNDISVVSNSTLVSSLRGDLISSISYAGLSRVDHAVVGERSLVITNSVTQQSVASHVRELVRRRDERADVDDVAELFDSRIRTLSSNHVVVRVPKRGLEELPTRAYLDVILRFIRSSMDAGVIDMGGVTYAAASVVSASELSTKCRDLLGSLGAVVTS